MKKYLSILLAMLFVFGFAASAFAVHADIPSETTAAVAAGATQMTLSGEIRVRYDWRHVSFNDQAPDTSFFNERVRLGLEAKLTPNTTGMIQLTSDNNDSTKADPDNMVMGVGGSASSAADNNAYSKGAFAGFLGNEFKGTLNIRQMWILHTGTGIFGVPSGIKIGHMPLILGSGLFFDHTYFGDDAFVFFIYPVKELELDAIAIKFREGQGAAGTTNLSNGAAAYAFAANYKPSATTGISFDATYVDAQNVGHTSAADKGMFPDVGLWNIALRGNTEWEGWRFKIDGEVQTGEMDQRGAAVSNLKYSGYAVQAGIGYTLAPVKLDLEFGYGSGDNGRDANHFKGFITSQGPESTFGDPYRSMGVQGPYVYNYRTVNAANQAFGGLTNTWYLRLGGNADLAKDLNGDIALYYLQAVDAITATNAALGTTDVYGFGANAGNSNSRDIGFEADYRLTYKIDKGLQTWVEGGYLWAGDFWKNASTVAKGNSPTDAFTTRIGLQLNF